MHQHDLDDLAARARAQVFDHILPFWCGPALDMEQGGWHAWMTNDLKVDRTQPKGLIVNSRILWAFSAAFRARPEKRFREMAERALEVVMERFWDHQNGGAFWHLDSTGAVRDDSKKIYGQAFYIYALAEYHQAFNATEGNNSPALRRANELFELVEAYARDAREGGYFEVRGRDWSEAADSRLSDKDMDEKKSMNNHLHLLEAYLNLYRAGKSPRVSERLLGLAHLFETRIVDAASCHFNHFFDENWNVRSNSYTFGHDIEGSWLLCEAAEVLQDALLFQRIRTLAIGIADTVLSEGLDSDGGVCYEGKAGSVIDRRKECWPQAEAVVGFLNAYELSGKEKYLAAAKSVWSYIERLLMDRTHGEWFWRINLDGRPDPDLPKVSEWKGPYHGTRACLEMLKRLPRLKQI